MRKVIASGTDELKHIERRKYWPNSLAKVIDNFKFIAFTRAFMGTHSNSMNL